jgi:RimJ/RimL family protein N-acetyltransferase
MFSAPLRPLREVPASSAPSAIMPFELQPTLTGELIELRPLREADFDALFAVASDPLIWEQHPEPDRCTEPVFRRFFRGAIDSGGAFLAIDRGDGRVIGSSRFAEYDEAKSEIEIGWTFLARSHWGGEYNGEMKRLMLAHALRFVRRVLFRVGPHNHRSLRALEKIGARYVALENHPQRGEFVLYEITP